MPKIAAKRKKRKKEEVQEEILKYLGGIDHPTTTTEISSAMGLNWYSAMAHLVMLRAEGKIFHKKIGRQDQWFDVNVNESRRLAKELKATVDEQRAKIRKQERVIAVQAKEMEKLKERIRKLEITKA